ncbi:hypothetical protein [Nonomuraea diastatica]|uniref:Uncharacterized protein n=1 Tax=Nonomuraea diastatica TaxID=1848329 RepID=A0A4R4VDB8_9ACTN|nr:hypothetical protein [Nonomuraea diastatica]TDD03459.1 hypothetical protein E1294_50715 [Nonomuraea diastatica]
MTGSARALNALARIWTSWPESGGLTAIWDMTSISLHGDYDEADPEYARPRFGHPKDRRPGLKQIQAGIAASADGSIPVSHRAYDGAAGEVARSSARCTPCNGRPARSKC